MVGSRVQTLGTPVAPPPPPWSLGTWPFLGWHALAENHLAQVVRSKPDKPAYGKRHIPPLFGPIRVPYLKGLNCLFNGLQNQYFVQ